MILLTGPSGCGKSLITKVVKVDHPDTEAGRNVPRIVPVVRIEAENLMDKGYFSIRDLWLQGLEEIDHPLVCLNEGRVNRLTTSRYATAFGKALRALSTRFLVIDEAQHMRSVQGGDRNAQKLLDSLKLFAERYQLVLVLSGAYPLLQTVALGAQLSRRTHRLVLHRYFSDRPGDLLEFRKISEFCCNQKGLKFNQYIEPVLGDLYEATLGIFGTVEHVVDGISFDLKKRGEKNPTIEEVRKLIWRNQIDESIRQETLDGEEYLYRQESEKTSQSVGRKVGLVVKKQGSEVKRKRKRQGRDHKRSEFS